MMDWKEVWVLLKLSSSLCVRVCSGFWPIDVSCCTPVLTPGILVPSSELTCQTLQRLLSDCLYILGIWIAAWLWNMSKHVCLALRERVAVSLSRWTSRKCKHMDVRFIGALHSWTEPGFFFFSEEMERMKERGRERACVLQQAINFSISVQVCVLSMLELLLWLHGVLYDCTSISSQTFTNYWLHFLGGGFPNQM